MGYRGFALLIASFFVLAACRESPRQVQDSADAQLLERAKAVFTTLPGRMPGSEADTPERIALGRRLFFENRLSINNTLSCNSCHRVDSFYGGVDNQPTSQGFHGQRGTRNSPTVINAGFQVAQFWDGRSPTLREQAKGPMLNSVEMGMPDSATVITRLRNDETFREAFRRAFPGQAEPVTYTNVAEAMAAFERTLISQDRFDQYLEGRSDALTVSERRGLQTFMDLGCQSCHTGSLLGGSLFMKTGLFHPYPYTQDPGRFSVTGKEEDRNVFKVPMLRNAIITGPYYHDGQVQTIAEGIDLMGFLQLNKQLTNAQIDDLMRFMVALTGTERMPRPKPIQGSGTWKSPNLSEIPAGEEGALIRYGRQLLAGTHAMLGPSAKDPLLRFSGNALACKNCHQDEGTKEFGLPLVGVSQRYPQFRGREGRVGTLEDRINGCMERSMNGRALPKDGREMRAMVAYMNWLSQGTTKDMEGTGTSPFTPPNRRVNLTAGENVYRAYCQSCHAENGEGYRARVAGSTGEYVAPALWGKDSYNIGAGMARVLTAAAFIQGNMPLGTPWNHPMLNTEQAYDVAGYINSKERPQKAGLEKDYPDLTKKPVDCPYPPYADKFSVDQHRFGPFQPIEAARKNATSRPTTRTSTGTR